VLATLLQEHGSCTFVLPDHKAHSLHALSSQGHIAYAVCCEQASAMLCRWKSSITHVVLPSLVRSVKSLAGMAGGCWILHADFVDACASAEALMEPVSTATW